MEQTVTIELVGEPPRFRANSEVTRAKEVADLLAKEVARVEKQQSNQSSNISELTILMLAALNIANEHMELKRNHSNLLSDVAERTANLIRTLDNCV